MGNLEKLLNTSPLFLPAVSLMSGIVLSNNVGIEIIGGYILILCSAIIYLILSLLKKNPVSYFKLRNYHYIWLSLSFAGLGIITYDLNYPFIDNNEEIIKNCTVSGIVESVSATTSGDKIILKVIDIKDARHKSIRHKNLKIRILNKFSQSQAGDLIKFTSDLYKVQDSENSFRKGYAKYSINQGILLDGEIKDKVIKTDGYNYRGSKLKSLQIRDKIIEHIEYSHLNKQTQHFLITLLLGDKDYIDPELRMEFSKAGISHILALSGMHVGIIAAILFSLLFPLSLIGKYKWRYIAIIAALWFYCFLTGWQPSTLRAVIMCSFAFTGIIIERKNYALNSLCAALLLTLIFSPLSLYDLGFQMSFICVFTIISFSKILHGLPQRKHPYVYKTLSFIFITIVATFSTWVLSAYNFHIFPLSFLWSNVFILPQLPIFIFINICYLILSAFDVHLFWLGAFIDNWFKFIIESISYLSSDNTINIDIPIETVIFWLLGIILIAFYIHYNSNKLIISSAVASFIFSLTFIFTFPPAYKNHDYIVCSHTNDICVNIMVNGIEKYHRVERNTIHSLSVGENKILIIDSNINNNHILKGNEAIILAAGFKGDINELSKYIGDAVVILHSSIRREKENEIMSILRKNGKTHHSLRNDGPYKSYD